jgi:hypothetical protein
MTTGAVIFAYNNEQIDYVSMARWSACNIKRHLGIPTTIITDLPARETTNSRWFADLGTTVTWHNENRSDVYELSPYDRTLVLDADYVVASDQLTCLLESNQKFLAPRWAYDVTGSQPFDGNNFFGRNQMPMHWATVMMFQRSPQVKLIFDLIKTIRDNWQHYRNLYGITRRTFRNDYALSIAISIVDGHTFTTPGVPWSLASVTSDHTLVQVSQDQYRVEYVTADNKPKWITLNHDFHAMGKRHLGAIVANPC